MLNENTKPCLKRNRGFYKRKVAIAPKKLFKPKPPQTNISAQKPLFYKFYRGSTCTLIFCQRFDVDPDHYNEPKPMLTLAFAFCQGRISIHALLSTLTCQKDLEVLQVEIGFVLRCCRGLDSSHCRKGIQGLRISPLGAWILYCRGSKLASCATKIGDDKMYSTQYPYNYLIIKIKPNIHSRQ